MTLFQETEKCEQSEICYVKSLVMMGSGKEREEEKSSGEKFQFYFSLLHELLLLMPAGGKSPEILDTFQHIICTRSTYKIFKWCS